MTNHPVTPTGPIPRVSGLQGADGFVRVCLPTGWVKARLIGTSADGFVEYRCNPEGAMA